MKRMHGHANPKYAGSCCADITHIHHQPADDVINRSPGSVPDGNWSKRGSSCSPGLPSYNIEQHDGALQQLGLICHLQLFLGTWHHKLFFQKQCFFLVIDDCIFVFWGSINLFWSTLNIQKILLIIITLHAYKRVRILIYECQNHVLISWFYTVLFYSVVISMTLCF